MKTKAKPPHMGESSTLAVQSKEEEKVDPHSRAAGDLALLEAKTLRATLSMGQQVSNRPSSMCKASIRKLQVKSYKTMKMVVKSE